MSERLLDVGAPSGQTLFWGKGRSIIDVQPPDGSEPVRLDERYCEYSETLRLQGVEGSMHLYEVLLLPQFRDRTGLQGLGGLAGRSYYLADRFCAMTTGLLGSPYAGYVAYPALTALSDEGIAAAEYAAVFEPPANIKPLAGVDAAWDALVTINSEQAVTPINLCGRRRTVHPDSGRVMGLFASRPPIRPKWWYYEQGWTDAGIAIATAHLGGFEGLPMTDYLPNETLLLMEPETVAVLALWAMMLKGNAHNEANDQQVREAAGQRAQRLERVLGITGFLLDPDRWPEERLQYTAIGHYNQKTLTSIWLGQRGGVSPVHH